MFMPDEILQKENGRVIQIKRAKYKSSILIILNMEKTIGIF